MFDGADPLPEPIATVTLPMSRWNLVLQHLALGSIQQMGVTFSDIQQQLQQQLRPEAAAPSVAVPEPGDG